MNALLMLIPIIEKVANNVMYTVQELHTFL